MDEKELEVIANRAMCNVCGGFPDFPCPPRRSYLEEDEYRNLKQGHREDVQIFGRVQNPRQLGELNVIQMDFTSRLGDELALLIVNVPATEGFSIVDIIQQRFATVEVIAVREPVLHGTKVIVALAPCYVEATQGMTTTISTRNCAAAASYHLKIGNVEQAFRIIQAATNSWGGSLEELCIKGQAATELQLYDAAAEAYTVALNLASEDQRTEISGHLEEVKRLQARSMRNPRPVDDEDMVDYVSEKLEVRPECSDEHAGILGEVGVFAKDLIHAGEVVMVSNGVEEGLNAFAMVLDACSKSSRLARQVELLWYCKQVHDAPYRFVPGYDTPELDDDTWPGIEPYMPFVMPDVVSFFKPPRALDEDCDILVSTPAVWCAVKRARMKGNGSSLWPFACFFKELGQAENTNLEVQLKGRTMVLPAKRDIEPGEELTVPANEDVVETRFFYKDGGLVREETLNGGESVGYKGWAIVGELPPPDTDWCSFVNNPLCCRLAVDDRKPESDGRNTDEIVALKLKECWTKRELLHLLSKQALFQRQI